MGGQQEGGVLRAWLRRQPRLLRELEAGAFAGGLAKTCVAPLERTKILFQTRRVSKEMGISGTLKFLWKTEGLGGLFRGNTASVLRIMPYAAIHFSVYEHYRRIIKEFTHPEDHKQQHQQQQESLYGRAGSLGSKEREAAAAVARVLRPEHSQAVKVTEVKVTEPSARRTAEKRAQVVAAVVDQVMAESSSSGSSIDVTAAMVAAEAQLEAQGLEGAPPAAQPTPSSKPAPMHPVWDLVAGSMSGATAVMITYPLDLVRTRLAYATESALNENSNKKQAQTQSAGISSSSSSSWGSDTPHSNEEGSHSGQRHSHHHLQRHHHHHHSIASLLRAAVRAEGFRGLYMGVTPTLMGILPYAGLKFYVYQSLKHAYNRRRASSSSSSSSSNEGAAGQNDAVIAQKKLPIPIMLLFGGTAGLFAQTLTYPLDIVRRRMQVEGYLSSQGVSAGAQTAASPASTAAAAHPNKHHTSLSIARMIVAEDGLRGLFRGLSINYLKVVPSTAIGFTAYEHLKHYLDVVGNL